MVPHDASELLRQKYCFELGLRVWGTSFISSSFPPFQPKPPWYGYQMHDNIIPLF